MHGWYDGWSWWGWVAMTIGMVAFWGMIVWLIATSFGRSSRNSLDAPPKSAEELLAERLAAGDIDESEYRSRIEALRSTTTSTR